MLCTGVSLLKIKVIFYSCHYMLTISQFVKVMYVFGLVYFYFVRHFFLLWFISILVEKRQVCFV